MTPEADATWRPIEIPGQGAQPDQARKWACYPAWGIDALYDGPDRTLQKTDALNRNTHTTQAHFFVGRHVDKRYRIPYPRTREDSPRLRGLALGDPKAEWDALVDTRDRYLKDAGLALDSPPAEIARTFAESFRATSYFKDKPASPFTEGPRRLDGPIEGLLYKSYCTGCAWAFTALADVCALEARALGIVGHFVAEVRIDGHWRLVDSVARHEKSADRRMYFPEQSFLDALQDAASSDHDFFGRSVIQFHFTDGMLKGPKTLRYAAQNCHALYPSSAEQVVPSADGRRLRILDRAGGFYWPSVHGPSEREAFQAARADLFAGQPRDREIQRDFLYQRLDPGQKVRQSVYLDGLADVRDIELTLPLGDSGETDFSARVGQSIELRAGELCRSLHDLGAWPPAVAADGSLNRHVKLTLPPEVFASGEVNWIELINKADTPLHVPCVPAVMEPYVNPLGRE